MKGRESKLLGVSEPRFEFMWVDLLKELVRTFLLLRDLFGYLLPGGTFLCLWFYSPRCQVTALFIGFPIPAWGALVVFVLASYLAGHFLAAAGHAIQDVVSWAVCALRGSLGIVHGSLKGRGRREARGFPLKAESLMLYYRKVYPQLFIELDRRDTLALLRTGMGACFLLGSWLFPISLSQGALFVVGTLFLLTGYAGRKHVALYRVATLRAALRAERAEKHEVRV